MGVTELYLLSIYLVLDIISDILISTSNKPWLYRLRAIIPVLLVSVAIYKGVH